MDFEKLKQWLEISQNYQNGKFWDTIFDQPSPNQTTRPFEEEKSQQNSMKDFPKTDIYLTDTAVIVLVELPGVIKEDVYLTVSGTRLAIRGILKLPIIHGVTVQSERYYGEFQRVVNLPEPAEGKDIQAKFENGLLVITYGRRHSQEERIVIK